MYHWLSHRKMFSFIKLSKATKGVMPQVKLDWLL